MKLALALSLFLGGVVAAEPGVAPGVTDEELSARFWYDLGPAEVDVSGYPDPAKKGYALFRKACTVCHSGARALNSPMSKREDWSRFVKRMHVKGASKKGAGISRDEGAAIVEFLAYDSKARKLDRRSEFEAKAVELQGRFAYVRAERKRWLEVEAQSKAVPPAPYTGVKP